jgi:hypothetical protein
MSDWIPSQAGLRGNPKTRRAARALGIPVPHLVGHLHCLWWWALEYAPDGDVEDFEHEDLADAAGWEGDAEAFVAALFDAGAKGRAGFLAQENGRLVIHDWEDNQGSQYRGRILAAQRKRAQREREGVTDAPCDDPPSPESHAPVTPLRDTVTPDRDLARAKDRQDRTGQDRQDRTGQERARADPGTLTALFVDRVRASGQVATSADRGRFARAAKEVLDQGCAYEVACAAVERMVERRLGPHLLGQVCNEVKAGPRGRADPNRLPGNVASALALVEQCEREEAAGVTH